jgi:hypothetical protein
MAREITDETKVEAESVKEPVEPFSTLFTKVDPVWLERATKAFLLFWAIGSIGFNGDASGTDGACDGGCWQKV